MLAVVLVSFRVLVVLLWVAKRKHMMAGVENKTAKFRMTGDASHLVTNRKRLARTPPAPILAFCLVRLA